jgi:hypothetical protein
MGNATNSCDLRANRGTMMFSLINIDAYNKSQPSQNLPTLSYFFSLAGDETHSTCTNYIKLLGTVSTQRFMEALSADQHCSDVHRGAVSAA